MAASSATYASAFHDITKGNNNCLAGTNFCSATTGFAAGAGYDEVTGLGSVDLNTLAGAWPAASASVAALIPTTTKVTPANGAPNVNEADTFTIAVAETSGSGTPTGNVTLQIDAGTTAAKTVSNQALVNGSVTYSATFTSGGSHQVLAQYLGDATHAPSVGVGEVVIATSSSGKGTIAMAAAPSTLTVSQGSSGSETLTVTPSGGYTGTVLLTLTTSNDTALGNLCFEFTNTNSTTGQGSVVVNGTAAVTTQLTLDSNAADCSSATGGSKPGMHPLRRHVGGTVSRNAPRKDAPQRLPAEAALAALLFAGFLGRYARKFRAAAWVLVLGAAGLAMSACGSSSVTTTFKNPAKGTYTITVTGADSTTSSITNHTSFTFTIN